MADDLRSEIVARPGPVVVKVGTNVLAKTAGGLDRPRMQALVAQLSRAQAAGRKAALVSSGAIGAGVGVLGLAARPTDLPHLQACAAVGQCALMRAYQECMSEHGGHAAQILLTAGDFDHRVRYLNARHTILNLFDYNCLPVINENDTVSVAEIKFGDNDHLAAMVANLLQAPLLVLLTNVDGLFTADPRKSAGRDWCKQSRRSTSRLRRWRPRLRANLEPVACAASCGPRTWRPPLAEQSSLPTARRRESSIRYSQANKSGRSSCHNEKPSRLDGGGSD